MEKEIKSLSDEITLFSVGTKGDLLELLRPEKVRESIRLIKKDIKGLNGEKALNLILKKRMGNKLT